MKITISISKKLRGFLRERGILEQFANNCKHSSMYMSIGTRTDIISSFMFDKTPEGHDYWLKLSDEFTNHLIK